MRRTVQSRTAHATDDAPSPASFVLASLPRSAWAIVIAIVAFAWFSALDLRKLQHPDEGRYAEIAREMAVSGDWLTPRLNGIKYFEKPPLQYWVTAASYRVFEIDQWTARLAPATAGFLTIVAVGLTAASLAGPTAGAYAALVLAGCVWHIGLSHFVTLDALLSFLLACALCAFLLANREGLARAAVRRWMLAAWASIALAMLTKGLVAIAIPGATLVLYTVVTRDAGPWRRLHLLPGLALCLAIAAPWFVLVSRGNPGFAEFFFVHEHFQRFLTSEHRRTGAWWYFLPIFAVGVMPWLSIMPWTWRGSWRTGAAANGFRWAAFCLVWAAFVFVFFSMSGSKLPSYILPMFPALMLAFGPALAAMPPRRIAWLLSPLAIGAALLFVATLTGYERLIPRVSDARTPAALFEAYAPWARIGTGVIAAAALAGWFVLRRGGERARTVGLAVVAVGTLAGFQVLFVGHDAFRPTRSGYDILREAQDARGAPFDRAVPFYQVGGYDQTVPFYLGRTTTLVAFRDEFAMGLDMEPELAIPDEPTWIAVWDALPDGYALMPVSDHRRLAAQGVPMHVVATDPRRVLVVRR
ncbi:4-amino-4-deoxy-L-arabinose transferase [Burkholderiales bacterium]|nr:4-amino-4-deoxy-L-arabinose transferase [Burkholderiales bacterium]